MPIQYVGGKTAGRANGTSDLSVAINSGLTGGIGSAALAGDLVIVTVSTGTAARQPALAITTPSGYTALTAQRTTATTYDTNVQTSYKRMGSTPDTTVTIPASGNNADGQAYTIQVFRGVDDINPLDVTPTYATGSGTNSNPNPAAITPVTAGSWIVFCGGGAAATGAVYTASYLTNFLSSNGADTNDGTVGAGYYTAWTSGAYDGAAFAGGNANAANSWGCTTIALRPMQPKILTRTLLVNSVSTLALTRTLLRTPGLGAVVASTTGSPEITTGVVFEGMTGTVYKWLNGGTITFSTGGDVYYLAVAGGGGGGGNEFGVAGGGGAGGMVGGETTSKFTATASSYTITVGAGGTGGVLTTSPATNGGNSSITGANAPTAAVGGGRGGGGENWQGSSYRAGSGGSGGGGSWEDGAAAAAGTAGQGNDGGVSNDPGIFIPAGGGGGGAGGVGETPVVGSSYFPHGGDGGIGKQSSITGTATYYAGGGGGTKGRSDGSGTLGSGGLGGGGDASLTVGANGTNGLGGGGGAGQDPTNGEGGDGGSGVVIVFVPNSAPALSRVKYWTGAAWKPVKSWNGSAWVPVKAWDGAAWG